MENATELSRLFFVIIAAMGLGRVILGVAPFVAAGPASRRLGFPGAHENPTTRLMGRLFGVRDVGLGVLAWYALAHPALVGFALLFNALTDTGDLVAIGIPLVRREGIDRAAFVCAVFAFVGGSAWVAVWALLGAPSL